MTLPLLGTTPCTLDSKRRLTIPARLREFLGLTKTGAHLVITLGRGGCLVLFTPAALDAFMPSVLQAVVQGNRRAIRLRDILAQYGETQRVDSAGRVSLSESQMKYAGIVKDVMVFQSWTRAELWSPERFAAAHPEVTDSSELDALLDEFAGPLEQSGPGGVKQ